MNCIELERGSNKSLEGTSKSRAPQLNVRCENKFLMQTCPHCKCEIRLKELPHQGFFNSFRICPNCGGKFTVDRGTKHRQAFFIIIALISLTFTLLLYFKGPEWLIPSISSYIVLGVLIYWANRLVFLVQYGENYNSNDDT